MPSVYESVLMNETEFQAIFDTYALARKQGKETAVPQKLHVMVYNYARLRHQQSSDVAGDFYVHVSHKLEGHLERYDPTLLPFYQYMAATLNFEFNHFLRRRKLPRSQIELLSVEELRTRRIELQYEEKPTDDLEHILFDGLTPPTSIYARLSLAAALTFREMRFLVEKQKKAKSDPWKTLRAYRAYLRFVDEKRKKFLTERDRLLKLLLHTEDKILSDNLQKQKTSQRKKEIAKKKFFSIDTRIPIRIVADVTGDTIATAQRQLIKAKGSLKKAYREYEK